MATILNTLSNLNVLASTMKRRGLTVTVKGKVWSDELNTYVSVAEAFLAGFGKAKRTKAEQEVFDLLLVNAAGRQAKKWHTSVRVKSRRLDFDRERVMDYIIENQERMSKGMKLIQQSNQTVSKIWERNQYAGYVYKAWTTDPRQLTEKQVNSLRHKNNRPLVQWLEYRAGLWKQWNALQKDCQVLAEEHKLWPEFFKLARLTFGGATGFSLRPQIRDEGIEYGEQSIDYGDEARTRETAEQLAYAHVAESRPLYEAIEKSGRRGSVSRIPSGGAPEPARQWKPFRKGSRVRNKAFGHGIVIEVRDLKALVRFKDGEKMIHFHYLKK